MAALLGRPFTRPGGRPSALGLADSIALVVYLIRKNPTQEEAAAIFDVSQSTVSRRWDLLRPLIGKALAREILPASKIGGAFGTYLVDGTICPTWDWRAVARRCVGSAGGVEGLAGGIVVRWAGLSLGWVTD